MQVLTKMRASSSEEYRRKHGTNTMKVTEEEVLNEKDLVRAFVFGCGEAGITEPQLTSVLPEVHKILAKKMVHTYGNELLENRQLIGRGVGEPVIEVPLMLRDTLKVPPPVLMRSWWQ